MCFGGKFCYSSLIYNFRRDGPPMTPKQMMLAGLAMVAMLAQPAGASQDDATAAAHEEAVSAMIEALRLPELTLVDLEMAGADNAPNRQLFTHIRRHIGRPDLVRIYLQAYAPLVSSETARQIARGYRSPDGVVLVACRDARQAQKRQACQAARRRHAGHQALWRDRCQSRLQDAGSARRAGKCQGDRRMGWRLLG